MKTKYTSTSSAADVQTAARTLDNSIRRKWFALTLGGFLFTSIFALSPSPVNGQCPQGWNVSGGWRFKQSNQGVPNSLRLSVDGGGNISGQARYQTGGRDTSVGGLVSGRFSGSEIELVISWSNGLTGVYNGRIDSQGMITGTGYEKSTPSKKVSWSSERPMTCGEQAPQPRRPRS